MKVLTSVSEFEKGVRGMGIFANLKINLILDIYKCMLSLFSCLTGQI